MTNSWDAVFAKLRRWESDPSLLADDDVDPPSVKTIQLARRIAESERYRSLPPPTRVMANGEGGIMFEWVTGKTRQLVEISIHDDRTVELSVREVGEKEP